jgi:hypothetical protein
MDLLNGRVNLDTAVATPSGSFNMVKQQFEYSTEVNSGVCADLIKGNVERNVLNVTFFSPENIQIIQNAIQYEVYKRSQGKYRIGPQGTDNLLIIMRSIYYQYGKNLPCQIKEQIMELNKLVVEFSVPKILTEVDMYQKYREDITTLPLPFQHPVNISRTGTKSLPLKPFF